MHSSEAPERMGRRHTLVIAGDATISALCCSEPVAASYVVESVETLHAALARLAAMQSGLLITELHLPDGDGVELSRAAKVIGRPRVVLVTTDDVTRVPQALAAGCDSVLLKPFPPNLLFTRLGRLARDLQSPAPRTGSHAGVGTNEFWRDVACIKCGRHGVTSFEATSLRRVWYACPHCEGVWIARRPK